MLNYLLGTALSAEAVSRPVMKVVLGIRFSSWNPAIQLEKRIPSQSLLKGAREPILLKGARDEGCLGDPLFELESGIPARKADPQENPP